MAADRPPRRRALVGALVIVAVMLLGVGGGWVAAQRFESPAQREAAAQPPPPREVVVAVRSGVLEDRTTAMADVGDAATTSVALPQGSGLSVVTAAPSSLGVRVDAGSVVLEVSGRPVFALPGTFPFYRDLSTGATGPDVEQLQTALRDLGHLRRVTGTFDAATGTAVRRLYTKAGYDASLVRVTSPAPPAAQAAASGAGAAQGDAAAQGGTAVQGDVGDAAAQQAAAAPAVQPAAATVDTVTVPLTDLTVVTTLPRTFVTGPGLGEILTADSAYVLSDGALAVSSLVPASAALQMAEGSPVTLTDTAGTAVTGHVGGAVADGTAGDMRVSYVTDTPLPAAWRGTQVLATITLETVGQESLIVPNRSVVTADNGTLSVLRRTSGSTFESIPVTRLGTLAGQSAIAPVEAGALEVGDEVRVR